MATDLLSIARRSFYLQPLHFPRSVERCHGLLCLGGDDVNFTWIDFHRRQAKTRDSSSTSRLAVDGIQPINRHSLGPVASLRRTRQRAASLPAFNGLVASSIFHDWNDDDFCFILLVVSSQSL